MIFFPASLGQCILGECLCEEGPSIDVLQVFLPYQFEAMFLKCVNSSLEYTSLENNQA